MTQGVGRGSEDRTTHMKLEPPAKFIGKGLPTMHDWVKETENWPELSPCTPDQWIAIAGTKLERGASSWFHVEKARMREGQRVEWLTLGDVHPGNHRNLLSHYGGKTSPEIA